MVDAETPVQIIEPPQSVRFQLQRLTLDGVPLHQREEIALERARLEINRPFNLAQGPVLRAALFSISEHRHLLIWTMHHIATDGWTDVLLYRELSEAYGAFRRGAGAQASRSRPSVRRLRGLAAEELRRIPGPAAEVLARPSDGRPPSSTSPQIIPAPPSCPGPATT